MRVARVLAQAKINLSLHVGPRDASGYHEIATLFHRVDLADEVVVRAGASVRALDCSGRFVPPSGLGPPEQNLAFRAAFAYSDATGWPRGFSIELVKNIPVGGGLGGGSADAAAVLRALDTVAPSQAPAGTLAGIARSLGADVPFLLSEYVSAVGRRRGDQLLPVQHLAGDGVAIVVPEFAISTADAYRWLDQSRSELPVREETFHSWYSESPFTESLPQTSFWTNDFETVVEERYPKLQRYRERLTALGARVARLSGSGSCVFGIFEGTVPTAADLAIDAIVLATRASSRVVQVEVVE